MELFSVKSSSTYLKKSSRGRNEPLITILLISNFFRFIKFFRDFLSFKITMENENPEQTTFSKNLKIFLETHMLLEFSKNLNNLFDFVNTPLIICPKGDTLGEFLQNSPEKLIEYY